MDSIPVTRIYDKNGNEIDLLEEADFSLLRALGYKQPNSFVSKAQMEKQTFMVSCIFLQILIQRKNIQ